MPDSPEATAARDDIRRELADSAQSALASRQPGTAQELDAGIYCLQVGGHERGAHRVLAWGDER